MVKLFQAKMD